MEQVLDVPKQEIITRDNATVAVDGVAFYQVLDARRASYEIANLQQAPPSFGAPLPPRGLSAVRCP